MNGATFLLVLACLGSIAPLTTTHTTGVCNQRLYRIASRQRSSSCSYTVYSSYRCGSWYRRRRCSRSRLEYRVCYSTYSVAEPYYVFGCCSGYQSVGGGRCADINECEQNLCEHNCSNTVGSYTCSCTDEYNLADDGRSCLGPLLNISIPATSPTSLSIQWDPPLSDPRDGTILHYILSCASDSGDKRWTTSGRVQNYIATNLQPFTRYQCCVSAVTTNGEGPSLCSHSAETLPVPQMEVLDVNIINGTTVNVSWSAMLLRNFFQYTVYYSPVLNIPQKQNLSKNFTSSSSFGVITGLLPSADYYFQVTVTVNVEGHLYEGLPSELQDNATSGIREALYQLRIGPVDHCTAWTLDKAKNMERNIHKALRKAVNDYCQCNLPESHLKKGVFSCHHAIMDDHTEVAYRSTIVGIQNYTATDFLNFVEFWVKSTAEIVVDDKFLLWVNPACPAKVASFKDPECYPFEDKDPEDELL